MLLFRRAGMIAASVALTNALAACGTSAESGSGGACPSAVTFRENLYTGTHSEKTIRVGEAIGEGEFPPCDDGPVEPFPAETIDVSSIPGIDPSVAILVPDYSRRNIFVNLERTGGDLPKEVRELIRQ